MRKLVDEQALGKALAEVMGSGVVAEDYGKALHGALQLAPGREALADTLYDRLTSTDYPAFLNALREQGFEAQARQIVQQDAASLMLIDPQRAQKALSTLNTNALAFDTGTNGMAGETADEVMVAAAAVNVAYMVAKGLRAFGGITRHAVNTYDKFIQSYLKNRTNFNKFDAVLQETIRSHANTDWKNMPASEFNTTMQKVMDQTFIPMKDRSGLTKLLGVLHAHGVWGTITGLGSIVGAIALLSGRSPSEMSPRENLLLAQSILATLAVSPHFLNTLSLAVKRGNALRGKPQQESWAHKMGTHHEVPNIWGKDSFLPNTVVERLPAWLQPPVKPSPQLTGDAAQIARMLGDHNEIFPSSETSSLAENDSIPPMTSTTEKPATLTTTEKLFKSIGTAARSAAALGDTGFGVLGIVYGALGMKEANATHDDGLKAASALIIAGSGATAIGGAIASTALISTFSASAIAHPFLWGGAIIAGIGLMVELSMDDWRGNPEKQTITTEGDAWWDNAANLGVLEKDQADKRSYANTLLSTGTDRSNIPYNESIWDYERQEFDYFTHQSEKHGSAIARMNEQLRHV
jgi:hypothetical protein